MDGCAASTPSVQINPSSLALSAFDRFAGHLLRLATASSHCPGVCNWACIGDPLPAGIVDQKRQAIPAKTQQPSLETGASAVHVLNLGTAAGWRWWWRCGPRARLIPLMGWCLPERRRIRVHGRSSFHSVNRSHVSPYVRTKSTSGRVVPCVDDRAADKVVRIGGGSDRSFGSIRESGYAGTGLTPCSTTSRCVRPHRLDIHTTARPLSSELNQPSLILNCVLTVITSVRFVGTNEVPQE